MTSATSDYLLVTDYLDAPLIGPVGHCSRRGGAIQQPGEPFGPGGGPATCARSTRSLGL